MATRIKVVIDHDDDPDFSWLEQEHYNPSSPNYDPIWPTAETLAEWKRLKDVEHDDDAADAYRLKHAYDGNWYRNPANHVALCMVTYRLDDEDDDWKPVDSLGSIDFLQDSDDWQTGTFYTLAALAKSPYLQELAKDAGLK
jgi:hypothetical protein